MRDVAAELKALRLYGMVGAWEEIVAQGNTAAFQSSHWLIEHLLDTEHTDRAMRSISYQMHAAKFPVHRDLAGFDFEQSVSAVEILPKSLTKPAIAPPPSP